MTGHGLNPRVTAVMSAVLVALGAAIVVETAILGGGVIGFVLGPLFILAGILRLYLARRV